MRTLLSTAMPMARMIPAMPGRVRVARMEAMAPMRYTMFKKRAQSAMMPERP